MNKIYIPENYKPVLDAYDTQRAIAYIKETFQQEFSKALNLKRVSAPLFVTENSGLNDNLNGYERPVAFDIPAVGMDAQVVHSLAKWKRLALKRYNFTVGNGLYTDMNAIRRDEALDNIHSIYVDQWDWEKIITRENRNLDFLMLIVRAIVGAICDTNDRLHVRFPQLRTKLSRRSPSSPRRSWRICTPVWKPVPSGKTPLSGSIRLPASCRSADFSAPASPTTAAPPTMTTGI